MRRKIITILAALMCLTGCSAATSEVVLEDVLVSETAQAPAFASTEASIALENEAPVDKEPEIMVVYVCGAVKTPGVYELFSGDRINSAVEAAGGFTEDADTTYVNLAAPLSDGIKLKIPTVSETASGAAQEMPDFDVSETFETSVKDNSLININSATKEQLMSLPGIGESIAGRIIDYREKNGKFKKIEDIMNITGIKEKLFSKIKDSITV